MTARAQHRLPLAAALILVPISVFAQEAVIIGSVTVTAVHQATGNRFTTITDERGTYRVPARVGGYEVVAELQGFTTVTRSGLQVLVGQTITVSLQMAPSDVEETVTVTGETPLLSVSTSSLGGNVDPQQVQELPVQ